MKSSLRRTWLWFRNLIGYPPKTSLRDKAIEIADRVTTAKCREASKVSCPVCFSVLQTKGNTDLRMKLAKHLSLWHSDEIELQWDIMHMKEEPSPLYLPSAIIGVGMAAGVGALLAFSAKNH